MEKYSTHYLVISAMGTERPGIVNELTRHVSASGCNIVDSRLALFGSEFTLIMLLSGNWNAMARLESTLPQKSRQLDLVTMMKRTTVHKPVEHTRQMEAEIEVTDSAGIIGQFTQFFSDHGLALSALRSETLASFTPPRLKARFTLLLQDKVDGLQIRAAFSELCDRLQATYTLDVNELTKDQGVSK